MRNSSRCARRRCSKDERAKYRTLRRDPRTGVYRERIKRQRLIVSPAARPKDRHWPAAAPSAAACSRARPVSAGIRRRQLSCDCLGAAHPAHRRRLFFLGGRRIERARIATAGEFHQRFGAAVDRRMRRENIGKALTRIVDAHFHHRRGRARQFAAAFDLAQSRDHRIGIFRSARPRRHRREIRASATAQAGSRSRAARRARSARSRE